MVLEGERALGGGWEMGVWGELWRVGSSFPLEGTKDTVPRVILRGEGSWKFLLDDLYFSMKSNYCFLCVLFWVFLFVFAESKEL